MSGADGMSRGSEILQITVRRLYFTFRVILYNHEDYRRIVVSRRHDDSIIRDRYHYDGNLFFFFKHVLNNREKKNVFVKKKTVGIHARVIKKKV